MTQALSSKVRIPIKEVIEYYLPLQSKGKHNFTLCPFHNENNPSFHVFTDTNTFFCYGCKAWGDGIRFVMKYKGLSYVNALREISHNFNLNLKLPVQHQHQEKKLEHFVKQCHLNTTQINQFLRERGIDKTIGLRYKIGYANASAGFFAQRIIFPLRSFLGEYIAITGRSVLDHLEPKYLNSAESSVFQKRNYLYGLYELSKTTNYLVVVEGCCDVLSLVSHQWSSVALLGTAISVNQIRDLYSITPYLYFCMDGDEPGLQGMHKIIISLLNFDPVRARKTKFILLPHNTDPNLFLLENGKDSFANLVDNAFSLEKIILHQLHNVSYLTRIEKIHTIFMHVYNHTARVYLEKLLVEKGHLNLRECIFLPQNHVAQKATAPNKQLGINILDKPIAFMIRKPYDTKRILKKKIAFKHLSPRINLFKLLQNLILDYNLEDTPSILRQLTPLYESNVIARYLELPFGLQDEMLEQEILTFLDRIRQHYA